MNTINERLQLIVDKRFNGIKADFAKAINKTPTTINNILGTRKSIPSAEILIEIVNNIPEINLGWLLSGKGEMLKSKNNSDEKENHPDIHPSNGYMTYLLPLSAMGGSLTGFAENSVLLENCEAIVSPIANVDFAITVYGDSMSPEYPSGSRILIKKINPNLFIDWGKAYVLDTPNGVILKEIRESPKKGYVRCHSINSDPKYQPFDVPMQEIYGMYRVLMSLSAK